MASFNGFLFILSVVFAILRICSVETPDNGKASNSTLETQISSYKAAEGKPHYQYVSKTESSHQQLSVASSSSSSALSSTSLLQDILPSESASKIDEMSSTSSETAPSSSEYIISTPELELIISPTIAPATAREDLDSITPSVAVMISSMVSIQEENAEKLMVEEPDKVEENTKKQVVNLDEVVIGVHVVEAAKQVVDGGVQVEDEGVQGADNVVEVPKHQVVEADAKRDKVVEKEEQQPRAVQTISTLELLSDPGNESNSESTKAFPEAPMEDTTKEMKSGDGNQLPESKEQATSTQESLSKESELSGDKDKAPVTQEPAVKEGELAGDKEKAPTTQEPAVKEGELSGDKDKAPVTQEPAGKESELAGEKDKAPVTQEPAVKEGELAGDKNAQETKEEEEDSITAGLKHEEEEPKSPSEEMPSFDEFKRQLLQEEQHKSKLKQQQQQSEQEKDNTPKPKPRKVKQRKQNNYASIDCGAKIVKVNPEASNPFTILQENRDIYMLNPCTAKIWFIVELCDMVQVKTIEIANFELFSSTPESFRVYVSGRYPTREWTMLGTFQARDERDVQSFPLGEPIYAKYLKVEMLTHFGSEHYCPLSLLRVFGTSMVEELEDHEAGSQDDADTNDQDDDTVPILPPDPSVKPDDQPTKPNILATVGDTLFNMVKEAAKKISGVMKDGEGNVTVKKNVGGDLNDSSDSKKGSSDVGSSPEVEDKPKDKPSIVTLIPSEEEDKPPVVTNENTTANESDSTGGSTTKDKDDLKGSSAKEDESDFCRKVDDDSNKGSKSTSTSTNCELFVAMIGHSSLGCFMGRVLYNKRAYQNLTALEESAKTRTKQKVKAQLGVPAPKKAVQKTDKKREDNETEDDEKEKKHDDKKSKEDKEKTEESSNIEPMLSVQDKKSSSSEAPIQQNVDKELKLDNKNDTVSGKKHTSSVIEPSEAMVSVLKPDSNSEDKGTPALPSVSLLTTQPIDLQKTKSTSSSSSETSSTQKRVENNVTNGDQLITPEMNVKEKTSHNTNTADTSALSEDKKASSTEPTRIRGDTTSDLKTTCQDRPVTEAGDSTFAIVPSRSLQSECKAPTNVPHPKDVDVLEIQLLDGEGREGTAHPEKPPEGESSVGRVEPVKDSTDKVNGSSNSTNEDTEIDDVKNGEAILGKSLSVESGSTESSEKSLKEELAIPHVAEAATPSPATVPPTQPSPIKVPPTQPSPIKVPPTQPPSPEYPEQPDSVKPLPPPPLAVDQPTDAASTVEASLADDATLSSVLSKAASISAGLLTSGAQKESVLMRLTNRIKALEQNLTLSTMYMEKLNQKYFKMVEDMQKNFDKKVNLLTNATRKAETVIKSQKDQISKLQGKHDSMNTMMDNITKKLDNLNKEVMERHIIGLFLEVILIMILFVVFRRWDRARLRRDAARDAARESLGISRDGTGPNHPTAPPPMYTEEQAKEKRVNGKLSARELLLRSYSVPETVGPLTQHTEEKKKEPCIPQEVKKKKHRKRKASVPSDSVPTSTSSNTNRADSNHTSLVSRTAGLLFSPARGLINGISDSWRWLPVSADDSAIKSTTPHMNGRLHPLHKSKSLDVVPEETTLDFTSIPPRVPPRAQKKGRIPTPPPPPQIPKSLKKGAASTTLNHKRSPGQPPSGLTNISRRGRVGGYGNQFA